MPHEVGDQRRPSASTNTNAKTDKPLNDAQIFGAVQKPFPSDGAFFMPE
jgi:hypothetical protein